MYNKPSIKCTQKTQTDTESERGADIEHTVGADTEYMREDTDRLRTYQGRRHRNSGRSRHRDYERKHRPT